jgi:hypothetical protein
MLVDAPQFAVTMLLSNESVANHYIGSVNISYQNISVTLSTAPHSLDSINAVLHSVGAKASHSSSLGRFQVLFDLCPGVRIIVTKMMRKYVQGLLLLSSCRRLLSVMLQHSSLDPLSQRGVGCAGLSQ